MRNSYLRNLRNTICETWRNTAKRSLRKSRKLRKLSSNAKLSPKSLMTLLEQHVYARACQGNHIEMPQSATVARALRLITESTEVVPFWKCLTLRRLRGAAREAGRGEGGARRHRAAACWGGGGGGWRGHGRPRSEPRARRSAPRLTGPDLRVEA